MQPGIISSIAGITAAKLFQLGTDTLVDTADTVVAGTNDPTFYTITFNGVAAGSYRLVLLIGTDVVAIEPSVDVEASSWSVTPTASGGSGTGARTVTITVTLSSTPLQVATVRLTKGAETRVDDTDVNGEVVFNVNDGTWTVAITASGATFSGASLVVDGDESATYAMTATNISPSDLGMRTGYLVCYDEFGVIEPNVPVSMVCYYAPSPGIALDSEPRIELSDVDGLVTFTNLVVDAKYYLSRGDGRRLSITIPSGSGSIALNSIVGKELQ